MLEVRAFCCGIRGRARSAKNLFAKQSTQRPL
jgi:hypothetical protein